MAQLSLLQWTLVNKVVFRKTFKISILKQIQNKNFNADQDMELFVQLKLSSHNMGVGCIPKPRDLDQLWY